VVLPAAVTRDIGRPAAHRVATTKIELWCRSRIS
jgi:hypothetical protein